MHTIRKLKEQQKTKTKRLRHKYYLGVFKENGSFLTSSSFALYNFSFFS